MSIPSIIPISLIGPRLCSSEPFVFLDETTIVYIAGANAVAHSLMTGDQKVLFGPRQGGTLTSLTASRERNYLAVAEHVAGGKPSVSIYTVPSFRRRRTINVLDGLPEGFSRETPLKHVTSLAFSSDSSALFIVTADILVSSWNWEKAKCISAYSIPATETLIQNASAQNNSSLSNSGNGSASPKLGSSLTLNSSLRSNPLIGLGLLTINNQAVNQRASSAHTIGSQFSGIFLSQNVPTIAVNTFDNVTLAIYNPGRLKFLKLVNDGTLVPSEDFHIPFSESNLVSIAWISTSAFIAATQNDIFVIERKMTRFKYPGDYEESKLSESSTAASEQLENTSLSAPTPITCMAVTTRLVVIGRGNAIRYYTRSHLDSREFLHHLCTTKLKDITSRSMYCSAGEENILFLGTGQACYLLNLSAVEINPKDPPKATCVIPASSSAGISDIDVCARKSTIATLSGDRTIRIYNYLKRTCDLVKEYPEEPGCLALHPSGFYLILGFSDRLRLMKILSDDIVIEREFPLRGCKKAAFSCGGHMIAAAQGSMVHVYNSWTYELITTMKGHNGKICTISWSKNDQHLITGGSDGAVYAWNVRENKRENEFIMKGVSFVSAYEADTNLYAVGSDRSLRVICESTVTKELQTTVELSQIALANSGKMLIAATHNGHIKALRFPFQGKGIIADSLETSHDHIIHAARVNRLRISSDGSYLFSGGEDGCLCIFKITRKDTISTGGTLLGAPKSDATVEGDNAADMQTSISRDVDELEQEGKVYSEELLVTKADLIEKNNYIQELRSRKDELAMEHDYQMRLKEMNMQTKLKDLTGELTKVVEQLKVSLLVLKGEKEKQEIKQKENYKTLLEEHKQKFIEIEAQYSTQLITEYDKYQVMQEQLRSRQAKWDQQLKAVEAANHKELQERDSENCVKIQKKEQDIIKLSEEIELKSRGNTEYTKQQGEEVEAEIGQIIRSYETLLKNEQQVSLRLKGENGVMKKKFLALNKEIEECKVEISKLKENANKLRKVLNGLERDVEHLKSEISDREKAIQKQEKRVHELKKENQEREKYKFVLDYKIKDLKKQIEPKEEMINELKERIYEINEMLSQLQAEQERKSMEQKDYEVKLQQACLESNKFHAKVHAQKQTLKHLQTDLTFTMDYFQENDLFKRSFINLHNRFCKNMSPEKQRVQSTESAEFLRQDKFLKKSIRALKTECHEQKIRLRAEHFSWVQENRRLLQEIENLKREKAAASIPASSSKRSRPKSLVS